MRTALMGMALIRITPMRMASMRWRAGYSVRSFNLLVGSFSLRVRRGLAQALAADVLDGRLTE